LRIAMNKKIALFLPSFAGGGAEKVMLALVQGFLEHNFAVELVVANEQGPLRNMVDSRCNVVYLHGKGVLSSLPGLARYLKFTHPDILISSQSHANIIALWAARLARLKLLTVVCEHHILSNSLDAQNLKERLIPRMAKWVYPRAHRIVASSTEVAQDLSRQIHLPRQRIDVIFNPIDIKDIRKKSEFAPQHAWLQHKTVPVLLAAGRLHPVKDYPTMLRAFANVLEARQVRLIILGEGGERQQLEELVDKLGISDWVSMPGFVDNPYAYMQHADGFLLSSRHEGFALVIVEALACGLPVVSTRCPGGPAELLEGHHQSHLVRVGDVSSFADAINLTLDTPIDHEQAREHAQKFDIEKVILEYLSLFTEN
jgi:glycosyltransferase involved in cell wall biosynthesis